ncbi:MAG: serine/threonine protein kinase [Deltaproteobacteria bacterium]|nr:serine/threonine protein kinase [Deltaproteobacteria bacterium]
MAKEKYPVEFGNYRLLRKLAQGGMAEIFLAQDGRGQIVALKRILPHLAGEEGFIRMFLDEARIVTNLDHANVARVYDHGKVEGYYFMAMEYVAGHSLLALHEKARATKMTLPRGLLAFIIAELLAGLGHAHNARDSKGRHLAIVHRDVTPQNVMIGYDGVVKLIDFGVAKSKSRLTKTEAGFTKGKLSYMSPEQARGEALDGRSDLFSVGIILYEITTGLRLFNKEGPGGILSAIVNDPIAPPSKKARDYPQDLEAVVMKALEKNVNQRWQAADDMRHALNRFSAQERPKPSKERLGDLVSDLFGAPEHGDVIEEARSVSEPTPDQPVRAELARGASVRIAGKVVESSELRQALGAALVADEDRGDDTRMMEPERARRELRSKPDPEPPPKEKSSARVEITKDSVAVLPAVAFEDIRVPEPAEPFGVKVAKWIQSFWFDIRASWRLRRKRWVLALSTFGGLSLVAALAVLGVFGKAKEGIFALAREARQAKEELGLTKARDGGVEPTILVMESVPPGASITIDGLGAGCVTPCDIPNLATSQPLGIEVSLPGYRLHRSREILYPNAGKKRVSVTLEREMAGLVIESVPAGASVSINGKLQKGTTPMTIEGLPAQQIIIELEKKGFIGTSKGLLLKDGELRTESFELAINPSSIPPGEISVASEPSGCPVTIDGKSAGATPIAGYGLKAGRYTVEVKCEFHAAERREIEVEAGRKLKVDFSSEPNVFGYITIVPIPPAGTIVTVNGRVLEGWEFVKVVPGRHDVLVENRQLGKRKSLSLNVGPEERINRRVDLYQ